MNVSFNPQAGNSRAAAHRPTSAPAALQTQTSTQTAPAGNGGVEIQLSAAAQQLLSAQQGGEAQAGTPAGLAAAFLASAASASEAAGESGGAHQPFGQTVRDFTPGHLKQAAAAAVAATAESTETTEVAGDETATDPTAVQDGTGGAEDAPAGDAGDVAAAPAEETTDNTGTEIDVAVSTPDIGALLGNDETATEEPAVEETAVDESPAEETVPETTVPETTVTEGDLVDELLNALLDDGSNETVS